MNRLFSIFAVALLATGCDQMKSQDPQTTITTNPALPGAGGSQAKASIVLQWNKASGVVQGYKVEGRRDGMDFIELGTVQPNPNSGQIGVELPDLPAGVTYYFRVRSFNQGGHSPYTNVSSIKL